MNRKSATSWASSPASRARMIGNRGRDTKPEIAVRKQVHKMGLRFFVQRRPIPTLRRTADLLFPKTKVAVFVDGCFWHGCSIHATSSASNQNYWTSKIVENQIRDVDTTNRLESEGWKVIRIWAHTAPEEAAVMIYDAVQARKLNYDCARQDQS